MTRKKKDKKFQTAKDILLSNEFLDRRTKAQKYVTTEFQDYGYRLAVNLRDLEHKALYIKMAKKENRVLLERALSFTLDYHHAKNKGKIFMWKFYELKNEFGDKKKQRGNETISMF